MPERASPKSDALHAATQALEALCARIGRDDAYPELREMLDAIPVNTVGALRLEMFMERLAKVADPEARDA